MNQLDEAEELTEILEDTEPITNFPTGFP